jgi:gamma-glutamylcyclotransferase (GGCT)/AIG2-like uncharacterized protein YtfP
MKTFAQFITDIQSNLDRLHDHRKQGYIPKDKDILYFAYGHNTFSDRLHSLIPSAKFIATGTLKGFSMYFEQYANIRMQEGSEVKGVVWEFEEKYLKKLDGYEALHQDYNTIPVEVRVKNTSVECIAYIMDPKFETKKLHKKPNKEYIDTLIDGYKEHGLPLEQIKVALKNSV